MDDEQQPYSVIYLTTPALAGEDGEYLLGDGVVDMEASTGKMNEIGQQGWELITVDRGIAYWRMDVAEMAQTFDEPETCGTCAEFDGNMCCETRFSVSDNSLPFKVGCHKPIR